MSLPINLKYYDQLEEAEEKTEEPKESKEEPKDDNNKEGQDAEKDSNNEKDTDSNEEPQEEPQEESMYNEVTYYYKVTHLKNIYNDLQSIKQISYMLLSDDKVSDKIYRLIKTMFNIYYVIIFNIDDYWDDLAEIIKLYYFIIGKIVKILKNKIKEQEKKDER